MALTQGTRLGPFVVDSLLGAGGRGEVNIATVYEMEEADGLTALVMALVERRTLAKRIAEGPLACRSTPDDEQGLCVA